MTKRVQLEIQYLCPLLEVFDIHTSLKFYCEVLGFEVHESAGEKDDLGWAWLTWGDVNLMLNTMYETPERPPQPDLSRTLAHHDTTLYFGCRNVDGIYEMLVMKGLKLDPPKLASYGMNQLYLLDPDGYNICFQCKADQLKKSD